MTLYWVHDNKIEECEVVEYIRDGLAKLSNGHTVYQNDLFSDKAMAEESLKRYCYFFSLGKVLSGFREGAFIRVGDDLYHPKTTYDNWPKAWIVVNGRIHRVQVTGTTTSTDGLYSFEEPLFETREKAIKAKTWVIIDDKAISAVFIDNKIIAHGKEYENIKTWPNKEIAEESLKRYCVHKGKVQECHNIKKVGDYYRVEVTGSIYYTKNIFKTRSEAEESITIGYYVFDDKVYKCPYNHKEIHHVYFEGTYYPVKIFKTESEAEESIIRYFIHKNEIKSGKIIKRYSDSYMVKCDDGKDYHIHNPFKTRQEAEDVLRPVRTYDKQPKFITNELDNIKSLLHQLEKKINALRKHR